jgi:aquaporin Z
MRDSMKAAVSEFLGTLALCVIGAGAVCTDEWTGGAVSLLGVALAHGAILGVMIAALGPVSGAHFNPAVTVAMLAARKIRPDQAVTYIGSQLAGAAAGGALLLAVYPETVWKIVRLGTPRLSAGVGMEQGIAVELALTFFLVLVIFGMVLGKTSRTPSEVGLAVGGAVAAGILLGGPLTGAALNPARAFGPALASGTWDHHLVYWIGPVTGGLLAWAVARTVFAAGRKG